MSTTQNYNGLSFGGVLYNKEEVLMPAIAGASCVRRGLVTPKFGITAKTVIQKANVQPVYANLTADFADAGTIDVDTCVLDPIGMSVQMKFDKSTIFDQWQAVGIDPNFSPIKLTDPFYNALVNLVNYRISKDTEALFYRGKYSPNYTFDDAFPGIISLIKNEATAQVSVAPSSSVSITSITTAGLATFGSGVLDGFNTGDILTITAAAKSGGGIITVNGDNIISQQFKLLKVSATTASLRNYETGSAIVLDFAATSATGGYINYTNVQNALEAAINNLPAAIQAQYGAVKIQVHPHVMAAYKYAQGKAGSFNTSYVMGRQNSAYDSMEQDSFMGYGIEAVANMKPNTLLCCLPSNLFWGSNIGTEEPAVNVVDQFAYTLSQKILYRLDWRFAPAVGFFNEISLVYA